jgi:hypothetical protein
VLVRDISRGLSVLFTGGNVIEAACYAHARGRSPIRTQPALFFVQLHNGIKLKNSSRPLKYPSLMHSDALRRMLVSNF